MRFLTRVVTVLTIVVLFAGCATPTSVSRESCQTEMRYEYHFETHYSFSDGLHTKAHFGWVSKEACSEGNTSVENV